jgi:adenylate cyclase
MVTLAEVPNSNREVLGMQRSPEIEAVVRRFLGARARADIEAVKNVYSDDDDLLIIGNDSQDWYRGSEVFATAAVHWSEGERFDDELLRLEAFENGNTGWAAVEQRRTFDENRSFVFRLTVILQIEGGVWKIVHWHFSVPVADEALRGVELTTTLSDLLESVGTTGDSSDANRLIAGTATIVFTDIVDSTALSQSLGDAAWTTLIESHLEQNAAIVRAQGGSVVKALGDGGMYAFSSGAAAIDAAIGMQETIK